MSSESTIPAPANQPAAGPNPPVVIGSYEVRRQLGGGGMGVVFEAYDPHLRRRVALKTLKPGRTNDPKFIARFRREMAAIGNLDHPHLVRALYAGDHHGLPYLVMDYCEGMDLHQVVKSLGPCTVANACAIGRQVALGLQYIHDQKLVHRDIKPSNIMLTVDGQIKILDLGLAMFQPDHPAHETLSDTGQYMGTGDFMAPEQAADSHRVDLRADLYSLGCTLFKLLTGEPPFPSPNFDTAGKKLLAHATLAPPAIVDQCPDLPRELADLVLRLLEKDPAQRVQTGGAVAELLAPWAHGADLAALQKQARVALDLEQPTPAGNVANLPGAPVEGDRLPATRSYLISSPATMGSAAPSSIVGEPTLQNSSNDNRPALRPRRARRWLGWAAVVVVVAGGILVAWWPTSPIPTPPVVWPNPDPPVAWPADYPAALRERKRGTRVDLVALRENLATYDNWQGARHPVTTVVNGSSKGPRREPLWCRRVWGTGVYHSSEDELTLMASTPVDAPGITALALDDDLRRRPAAWSVRFARNDLFTTPRGVFFGWQQVEPGRKIKTYCLRLDFDNARHPDGDMVMGIVELTWKDGKELSWDFRPLMDKDAAQALPEPIKGDLVVTIDVRPDQVTISLNAKAAFEFRPQFDPGGKWGVFVEGGGARIFGASTELFRQKTSK